MARDEWLIAYGNNAAKERLLRRVREWVDFGMPTAAGFRLRVQRGDQHVPVADGQWTVTRPESQFIWTLDR